MIKVDEQNQNGYKIEVHHIENYKKVNETEVIENDSKGNIEQFDNNENSGKTRKKFHWLPWKRS